MAPTPPNVTKLPSQKVLASLTSQIEQAKVKAGTINGEIGQKVADAVEKHNVHAGALKLVAKLQRMDSVKLLAFLTHFDDYREKLGIDSLMATELPGMEEEEAEKRPDPMFKDGDKKVDLKDGPGTEGAPASETIQ